MAAMDGAPLGPQYADVSSDGDSSPRSLDPEEKCKVDNFQLQVPTLNLNNLSVQFQDIATPADTSATNDKRDTLLEHTATLPTETETNETGSDRQVPKTNQAVIPKLHLTSVDARDDCKRDEGVDLRSGVPMCAGKSDAASDSSDGNMPLSPSPAGSENDYAGEFERNPTSGATETANPAAVRGSGDDSIVMGLSLSKPDSPIEEPHDVVTVTTATAASYFSSEGVKIVLFTRKQETPTLWKMLASHFDSQPVSFAEIRIEERELLERFGVSESEIPKLLGLRSGGARVGYAGQHSFEAIAEFVHHLIDNSSAIASPTSKADGSARRTVFAAGGPSNGIRPLAQGPTMTTAARIRPSTAPSKRSPPTTLGAAMRPMDDSTPTKTNTTGRVSGAADWAAIVDDRDRDRHEPTFTFRLNDGAQLLLKSKKGGRRPTIPGGTLWSTSDWETRRIGIVSLADAVTSLRSILAQNSHSPFAGMVHVYLVTALECISNEGERHHVGTRGDAWLMQGRLMYPREDCVYMEAFLQWNLCLAIQVRAALLQSSAEEQITLENKLSDAVASLDALSSRVRELLKRAPICRAGDAAVQIAKQQQMAATKQSADANVVDVAKGSVDVVTRDWTATREARLRELSEAAWLFQRVRHEATLLHFLDTSTSLALQVIAARDFVSFLFESELAVEGDDVLNAVMELATEGLPEYPTHIWEASPPEALAKITADALATPDKCRSHDIATNINEGAGGENAERATNECVGEARRSWVLHAPLEVGLRHDEYQLSVWSVYFIRRILGHLDVQRHRELTKALASLLSLSREYAWECCPSLAGSSPSPFAPLYHG